MKYWIADKASIIQKALTLKEDDKVVANIRKHKLLLFDKNLSWKL